MKNLIVTLFVISFFYTIGKTQESNEPVKWSYEIKKIDSENYLLTAKAKIEKDWHLYGRDFGGGGPIPMTIVFEENKSYKLKGEITESKKPTEEYDDIFKININYFDSDVSFSQKVKIKKNLPFKIKMTIEAQACRTSNGICVPLAVEHYFEIK